MNRRLAGIAVLTVAALTAAILPVLDGRRVVGSAERVSMPVAGDCLVGVHSRWDQPPTTRSDSGWPPFALTTGTLGSCDQPGAGEVLAVDYGSAAASSVDASDYGRYESGVCTPAIKRVTERLTDGRDRVWRSGTLKIGFHPEVRLRGELAFPSPITDSSGRSWAACYALTLTAAGAAPFVLRSVRPADDLGSCEGAVAETGGLTTVPCSEPHTAQVLGRAYMIFGAPTGEDYLAGCREFARYITGAGDPTANGQLTIRVRKTFEWPQGPGICLAVVTDPSRTLSGSLYDVGDGPLPWT